MSRFLRFFSVVLLLAFALSLLPVAGASPQETIKIAGATPVSKTTPPALSAASAVLFDATSDVFLLEKDADERRPMASTTKIMTALVVIEQGNLEQTVTVPREAVGVEGSSIYLFEGERITVKTLLYALLLSSANDAATALAIHTAGDVAAFADLMNEKAADLGLSNTHFTNPHGLFDEAHYTTARELALIAATAMKNETFAEIVSTVRYTAPQEGTDATRLFLNHNRLLRTYEGAIGIKTGFTKKSGRCLVSAAQKNDLTLIAVTLDAPSDWRDHQALLDWGFAEYEGFAPTLPTITLPVVGGTQSTVTLKPAGVVSLTLPTGHGEIRCVQETPRFLFGGFEAGKTVGRLVFYMDGEILATVPLQTADGIERENLHRTFFEKLRSIFIK